MIHQNNVIDTRRASQLAGLCLFLTLALAASAADLRVRVTDAGGQPLKDAVVMAHWPSEPKPRPDPARSAMAQRHRHFVPHVLIVPQHAPVAFPNRDKTRHHVYSFSRAKTFNIKLYHGQPKQPIRFDTPGVVTLGCNIHDRMRGYIVVTTAPRWAKTGADGRAILAGLPASGVELTLWHPWMVSERSRIKRRIAADTHTVQIALDVSAPPKTPTSDGSGLQDMFDRLSR